MRSRRRGVSLSEIAKAVGVSESTASRALNGYPDIAKSTRDKVAEVAARLNYRPSPVARRLARGTPETIGYILPVHHGPQSDPFLSEMLEGISHALTERDWDLLICTVRSPEQELETYRRLASSGKVSGLIVTRTHSDDRRIELLQEQAVPFVAFGRTLEGEGYAYLDIDNEEAFALAVQHLADQGHRKIALIGTDKKFYFAVLRENGFKRGLAERDLECRPEYLATSDMSASGGERAMASLLRLEDPPTAVVCATDLIALGAMAEARRCGLRVGLDVSLIGYDGLPAGQFTDPPLTTMAQPVEQIGERLTEILIQIVEGADPSEFSEIAHAHLVSGASVGPPLENRQ